MHHVNSFNEMFQRWATTPKYLIVKRVLPSGNQSFAPKQLLEGFYRKLPEMGAGLSLEPVLRVL